MPIAFDVDQRCDAFDSDIFGDFFINHAPLGRCPNGAATFNLREEIHV